MRLCIARSEISISRRESQQIAFMARNPSANEDILYKCTLNEIRLRVISDLQKKLQEVYEYS